MLALILQQVADILIIGHNSKGLLVATFLEAVLEDIRRGQLEKGAVDGRGLVCQLVFILYRELLVLHQLCYAFRLVGLRYQEVPLICVNNIPGLIQVINERVVVLEKVLRRAVWSG